MAFDVWLNVNKIVENNKLQNTFEVYRLVEQKKRSKHFTIEKKFGTTFQEQKKFEDLQNLVQAGDADETRNPGKSNQD